MYAHERAARTVGLTAAAVSALTAAAVSALTAGETPEDLDLPKSLAHHLTLVLVQGRMVKEELYAAVIEEFGEAETVALVALVDQYLTTAAIVSTFAVPAPEH